MLHFGVSQAPLDTRIRAESQPDVVGNFLLAPSNSGPQTAEHVGEGRVRWEGRHACSVLTMGGRHKVVDRLSRTVYREFRQRGNGGRHATCT